MILVTVHTYNGGNGDEIQLLGIYRDGDEARLAVYELMKHYIEQYLNKRNVVPGRIEDEYLGGLEAIKNIKTLFPDAYEQVEKIIRPEFWLADINQTFSIEVNDAKQDFKEPIYDMFTSPAVRLSSYIEYDTVPKEEKKNEINNN